MTLYSLLSHWLIICGKLWYPSGKNDSLKKYKQKACPTAVCLKLVSENFARNRQLLKLPSVSMMEKNKNEKSLKNQWF